MLKVFLELVGGVRAAAFLGTALLLAVLLAVQTVRLDAAHDAAREQQLSYQKSLLEKQQEILKLERSYSEELTNISGKLLEENEDAKADVDKLVAGLVDGTRRLRSRFQCASNGVPGNPGASSGSGQEEGAGFGVADAEIAFGIARDGDASIRQLTACQQAYNALREKYGQANTE